MISIQTHDFSIEQEYQQLIKDAPKIGAIVTFTGLVREFTDNKHVDLFLEHYPEMTEKVLADIIVQAQQQCTHHSSYWPFAFRRSNCFCGC